MAKKPEAPRQLALIEQARQALEQATTFDEVVVRGSSAYHFRGLSDLRVA